MQNSDWWLTWRGMRARAAGRRVVFWGRSEDWVQKSLRKVGRPVSYIVDINPGYHGTTYFDLEVSPTERMLAEAKGDVFVVITSGVFEGIVSSLEGAGFQAGKDFCCCPEFYDFHVLDNMRQYRQEIIVSSSDYLDQANARSSLDGGGLYRYSIGPNTCECVLRGQFRQIEQVGDLFYVVEYVEMALYVLDRDFNVVAKHELDAPNYCGIAHDPKRDLLVLANSTTDCLTIYEREGFRQVARIPFSYKCGLDIKSPHHLNDVCIAEDHLYVSYFSYGGAWRKGQYDGGVSEFHLDRLSEGPTPLATGLWSPHSPKFIDGNLCYLDSMRGNLHINNQTVAAGFHGFARGLAFDGNYYYVGMSEDMYMSRVFSVRDSIMMNAGFFMVDIDTRASRFYPMLNNMNVHDLLVVQPTD